MRVVAKWLISLAIGAFFVWLAAESWPLEQVFSYDFKIVGTYLVAGDVVPGELEWTPPETSEGNAAEPAKLEEDTLKATPNGWYLNLLYLIPYAGILIIIHFLRVIRWYPLLRPLARVGFWRLNRVGAVGFMSVFLFPLRLGEFVRPYLIAQKGEIRMSEAMATIVVERVMDGLMTSLLLFIVLFFLPTGEAEAFSDIRIGSYIALGVFLTGITVLALAYWARDWTMRTIRRVVGRLLPGIAERIISILEAFLRGLSVLPDWRNFAAFVLITAAYWGINGVGLYIFTRGFGLHVPLLAAYAMMASVVVGMMIPNSPANVGSFWYFLLKPLELYGVGRGSVQATAAALGIWLMQLTLLLLFGCYFLILGKVSFRRVWSITTGHEEDSDEPPTSDEVQAA